MKKTLTRIIILLTLAAGLSSCASVANANLSNYNQTTTKVELSQNNFEVVGTAQGVYTAKYVFGIGGLSKKSAKANAVADMFVNADLTGAQAAININTMERISTYLGIVTKVEYTATCTVIEFTD